MADVAVADDADSNNEHGYAQCARPTLEKEAQNVEHHNKELIL